MPRTVKSGSPTEWAISTLAQGLDGVAPSADPTLVWLRSLAILAACFFLSGLVARLLAPVRDSWFAMFAGSFGGGFAYGLAYCVTLAIMGAHLAPIALVIPVFGGIMAAWAVSTIGSLGFGAASATAGSSTDPSAAGLRQMDQLSSHPPPGLGRRRVGE
jgi:predicted permease